MDSLDTRVVHHGRFVGESGQMKAIFELIRKAAKVDLPVLVVGETGTGKELVAREIHDASARRNGPFVPVNMGALATDLLASELFGHEKGAFTGATDAKMGRYEEADGGTLFLDEIGTAGDRLQVALLRVLEEGSFRPLGGKADRRADVRLIAATNEDLDAAVDRGLFREDLLYRLKVLCIYMPPLREHPEDIPMLARTFYRAANADFGFDITGIAPEAMERLMAYHWPGNTRELKNVIAQSCVLAEAGELQTAHLPNRIRSAAPAAVVNRITAIPEYRGVSGIDRIEQAKPVPQEGQEGLFIPLGVTLEDVQRSYTLKTLAGCSNNKTRAAELLGVSRKTLYDKLSRWGVKG